MKIHIHNPTTFTITEQGPGWFSEYAYQSSIGEIIVDSESYPEIAYTCINVLVFVRGSYKKYDNNPLKVKNPEHMPHILKALKEFCIFNHEPFEIESCIL